MIESFIKFNSGFNYLIFEKIIKAIFGLLASMAFARFLGVYDFGVLSYVNTFYTVFAFMAAIGIDSIIVNKLSSDTEDNVDMGSYFLSKLFISLMFYMLMIIFALLVVNQTVSVIIILIIGLRFLFQPFYVIDCFFEAKSNLKPVIQSRLLSFLISTSLKICFAFYMKDIFWIIYCSVFESFLVALFHVLQYLQRKNKIRDWRFSLNKTIKTVSASLPVIIMSGFTIMMQQTDKFFIGYYYSPTEIGLYSAGAQLSMYWLFVPTIIVSAYFPDLIRASSSNLIEYKKILRKIFSFAAVSSLGIAIICLFFSENIVLIVFGENFSPSSKILQIHSLSLLFLFILFIRSRYFVFKDLANEDCLISFIGFLICILANYFLINRFGYVGSAYAFLIAVIFTAIIAPLVIKKTRFEFIKLINDLLK